MRLRVSMPKSFVFIFTIALLTLGMWEVLSYGNTVPPQIYWTDAGADKIQRANLDGTNVQDLVTTKLKSPRDIALDVANGKMYWIDWLPGNPKIQCANLDGSNVQDLITTGLRSPRGIALSIPPQRTPVEVQTDEYEPYTQLNLPEGAIARLGKGSINEIAYSPDGKRLAVASEFGIWMYDAQTGEALDFWMYDTQKGDEFVLLTSSVLSVSFSSDGSTLASGSFDATVRLWDVATGKTLRTLTGYTDSVYSVSFSPDGQTLASSSDDGTILLWTFTPEISEPEPRPKLNK